MQFIKNGPDIPEPLLQAHEDGRVVFFCGAGVSYPAGLRGFDWLVDKLYAGLGATPSPIATAAIKRGQFDTAIGLLEQYYPGGRVAVRPQLARILTPDLSKPQAIATHEALLTLAKSREGRYRLITTNFDRLFEEVITRRSLQIQSFRAPLLPIPKNRLDGLVYLHGLLPATLTGSDLDQLVVSSGDFGRAYLTERWAARFVSELFRNYTVCFVGYSINDPVLRYMMDALAADRLLGESPVAVYGFGSYSKGSEEKTANEWRAKNVMPILYREHNHHAYLHRTLRAWADTYRDGISGKERIVAQYAMMRPLSSTKQDDIVGRVVWALSDRRALPAKRFADLDPAPSLDWLGPLTEARFGYDDLARFGVRPDAKQDDKLAFSLVLRPTPYARGPWMALAHHSYAATQWDDVILHVARWLARHLGDPKLILWIAKQGGTPHHQFVRLIAGALEAHPPPLPMQTLWRLVLSGRLHSHTAGLDLYDWCRRFKHDGFTPMLRFQLRDLLSPRVRLSEPFRGWEGDEPANDREPRRLKDLVDWEIELSASYVHSALKDLAKDARWHEALPELLSDATTLLRDTLDLMREMGGVDDRQDMSYMHQPSISEHPQNREFHDWTAQIDLARDAWRAAMEKFPERAQMEAERWRGIPYPLFKRLAFFAATHSKLFAPQQALTWLLADDHWWLWSVETQREALRLLVMIAPQLNAERRRTLEGAVLRGPPHTMFRVDIEPEILQRTFDRNIWLRLAKYSDAGAVLGADADARLQALSQKYPTWRLAQDERDEFPLWMGDGEDWRTFLATPKRCRDLVNWLREHPRRSDTWQEDDWGERCKRDFRRTASALIHLSQHGEWPVDRWREAMQAWSDETRTARSWRYVGAVLAAAPDKVVKELARSLSWWLEALAKTFSGNEAMFFTLIRRVLTLHREEGIEADDDPVSRAINHPVGQVTKAALGWWYRQSLEDGQGLPDVLTPIFTDLCRTNVQSFRNGRVLLATNVIALFRVDGQWARQYLLPLFEWRYSVDEARGAWEGFLWSPRIYRPMMEAVKPQFLATAQHYRDLGKHSEQYAALLTFAALEPGDTFSTEELAVATRTLPADGLRGAAQTLVRALEGAGEQRAEYWRNRVLPYLKSIWPKSRDVITPPISESLARLCVATQDAFPEALDELRHWLQPPDHPNFVVHLLHEAKLCERFPKEALVFLDAAIGDNAQWPPTSLKDCLDTIQGAQPEIEGDRRFQRLREYLRLHGQS